MDVLGIFCKKTKHLSLTKYGVSFSIINRSNAESRVFRYWFPFEGLVTKDTHIFQNILIGKICLILMLKKNPCIQKISQNVRQSPTKSIIRLNCDFRFRMKKQNTLNLYGKIINALKQAVLNLTIY